MATLIQLLGEYDAAKTAIKELKAEEWPALFEELKSITKQGKDRKMSCYSPTGYWESGNTYTGDTQWQRYCKYINSVLVAIRKGEVDYCYFVYQIQDLLKFEHDRLIAEWLPESQCFQVSLS